MNRAILLVFAHPDDESFGLAGTVARYSSQGVPVDLICATRGEKGTRVDVPEGVGTGTAREAELRRAAAIMGVRRIYFLDYIDAELDKIPPDEIVNRLLGIMRRLKPEVVITFGPDGITGHPDHIAIGRAATEAFNKLAAEGSTRKLYYVTIPASAADPEETGLAVRPDDEVTTTIDIAGFVEKKIQAIAAHASQQDSRDFLEAIREERNSPFLLKESLYLASPRATAKETDLFE